MKTPARCLLAGALLVIASPAFAAATRGGLLEVLSRAVVRAPLNTNTVTTRATPQGPVTITTQNTFNGTSGTFDTEMDLPSGNSVSVSGTVSASPGNLVAVAGSITGPAGQPTYYVTQAVPTASGFSVTSSLTPPGGSPITNSVVLTPPAAPLEDPDDFLASLLKRLRLPFPVQGVIVPTGRAARTSR